MFLLAGGDGGVDSTHKTSSSCLFLVDPLSGPENRLYGLLVQNEVGWVSVNKHKHNPTKACIFSGVAPDFLKKECRIM